MKKANQKFLLICFSFVAFSVTSAFGQNYMPIEQAMKTLENYVQELKPDAYQPAQEGATNTNAFKITYAQGVMRFIKESQSVSEGIAEAYNRLSQQLEPNDPRMTPIVEVDAEIKEMLKS